MVRAGAKFSVVIVEDHPFLRELTKEILERSKKFEVIGEAADGAEAIAVCGQAQPDLVVLDLKMPRRDGFQALPEIRQTSPHSKVVIYSMLQRSANESRTRALGAVAFIEKDVESEELVRRLLAVLEEGGSTEASRTPPPRDGQPQHG